MIPVELQPEPSDFDEKVRQPGLGWLKKQGIDPDSLPPKASDLPDYWRASQKQLWDAYAGVCAYLSIFFHWGLGASSTDHFVAKSKHAGGAYEWSNFRLSCLGTNRNKGTFDDILDPVGLRPVTFTINFASGELKPNPVLSPGEKAVAIKTIERLKLNDPENNKMRAIAFGDYCSGDRSLNVLKRDMPFVYGEIIRQGLV